jgi:hypothetical protein
MRSNYKITQPEDLVELYEEGQLEREPHNIIEWLEAKEEQLC